MIVNIFLSSGQTIRVDQVINFEIDKECLRWTQDVSAKNKLIYIGTISNVIAVTTEADIVDYSTDNEPADELMSGA